MVKREENDEVRAIYGAGNYVLSNRYKVFQVQSHIWHSWSGDRKKDHIQLAIEAQANDQQFCFDNSINSFNESKQRVQGFSQKTLILFFKKYFTCS